jgi:lysophospholipase L1-like esterase
MKWGYHFALLVTFGLIGCTASKNNGGTKDTLSASALLPFGRTTITSSQQLELISSASHFGFSFEGRSCEIYASIPNVNGHNYLQYELDGVYQKRLRIDGNLKQPIVLSAAGEGKHTVWVYKGTEAHTGPIFIEKIEGNHIKPLQNSKAPLIEFIGNSITCGAAADASEVACGKGEYHDQHNAYQAYGPRVARALKANFIVSGVSGIGIFRNWNSDGPTMPQVYEKMDLRGQSVRKWEFTLYSPKVVSIALGTNDFSTGDGKKARLPFDSAGFVSNYIRFVQLVKSKYPDAQVALLSSAMVSGSNRITLQNCLTAVKRDVDRLYPSAEPVALYFFNPMQARGCNGHPSVEDHAILAEELLPFFKKLL